MVNGRHGYGEGTPFFSPDLWVYTFYMHSNLIYVWLHFSLSQMIGRVGRVRVRKGEGQYPCVATVIAETGRLSEAFADKNLQRFLKAGPDDCLRRIHNETFLDFKRSPTQDTPLQCCTLCARRALAVLPPNCITWQAVPIHIFKVFFNTDTQALKKSTEI